MNSAFLVCFWQSSSLCTTFLYLLNQISNWKLLTLLPIVLTCSLFWPVHNFFFLKHALLSILANRSSACIGKKEEIMLCQTSFRLKLGMPSKRQRSLNTFLDVHLFPSIAKTPSVTNGLYSAFALHSVVDFWVPYQIFSPRKIVKGVLGSTLH